MYKQVSPNMNFVDREKEIDAFNSKEYWEMYLNFVKKNKKLKRKNII